MKVFTIATAALGLAVLSGCANVEPRPQCDFYAYKRNFALAEQGPQRLVPQVPGSITEMPLNYANVTDVGITNKILIQATSAQRNPDGSVRVFARMVNCTDHTLQVEGRATFFNEGQIESEPATAWTRLILSPHTYQSYATHSTNPDAALYLIELREGS